ncbi:MAG TPA: porin [Beijerinckiaceae bacterium]|nr:porin [Beijerinckiaceae bacterium]
MKLLKSLLLAAPATLVAAVAAQAADLPSREAAPIHYVRICDAYGAGFFFIPGTNTCLNVGGYVRAQYDYTPGQTVYSPVNGAVTQVAGAQDTAGIEVRGRVDLDARTQTEWGTAQTVIWMRATDVDGLRNSPATAAAIGAGGVYAPAGNGNPGAVFLERAYIRFAGITAGVSADNFVTMPYMYTIMPWAIFGVGVKQLAYTATFGGGFSSTLAIESRGDAAYSNGTGQYTYNSRPDTGYNLVGNLRYDASWGFAQLSGALGNNSVESGSTVVPNSVTLKPGPGYSPLAGPQTYGAYAIGFGAALKLPMISAGDVLNVSTAYGHGMLGFVGCENASDCNDGGNHRWLGGVLRADANLIPTSIGAGGVVNYGTTNSWNVAGMYTHHWSPTWRTNLAAAYQRIETPTASAAVLSQLGNADIYAFAGNLIWSPTKNFDIGVELAYLHLNQSIQNPSAGFVAAGSPGLHEGNWTGKLRLERLF